MIKTKINNDGLYKKKVGLQEAKALQTKDNSSVGWSVGKKRMKVIFLDNPYIQFLSQTMGTNETFEDVRLRYFFPTDIVPFQIGILGSLGQIYQSLQQGTYPIDFDKWLGLSAKHADNQLIIIYTLQGPQIVKGRFRCA